MTTVCMRAVQCYFDKDRECSTESIRKIIQVKLLLRFHSTLNFVLSTDNASQHSTQFTDHKLICLILIYLRTHSMVQSPS